jgi:hypothetical protein
MSNLKNVYQFWLPCMLTAMHAKMANFDMHWLQSLAIKTTQRAQRQNDLLDALLPRTVAQRLWRIILALPPLSVVTFCLLFLTIIIDPEFDL